MNAPVEKLAADVRILVADVEELVKGTAAQSGEKLAAARSRVQAALVNAKDTVVVQGKTAVEATDRYVKENTWTAVGVSAGIGLLVGLLIGRR
jgi:ElaB/YqjD/DUF883 family membrane-anchored ribosome-binding protein